jgi:hypothetical protein
MNKYFFIEPRQTGKTTRAVYEFLKEPETTLFVTYNMGGVKHIRELLGKQYQYRFEQNICTSEQFIQGEFLRGKRFTKVILDEYLFFNKKDKFYKHFYSFPTVENVKELLIYSTSNKIYDRRLFDFVVENKKKSGWGLPQILGFYINEVLNIHNAPPTQLKIIESELSDLYYNFLTDHNIKIVTTLRGRSLLTDTWVEHIKKYEPDTYKTEILGKYLTEEPTKTYYTETEEELIPKLRKGINKSIEESLKSFDSKTFFGDFKVTYEFTPKK